MGVCDVSLITSDKSPRKMWNKYGSSYVEDNINEAPLTLSVSPWENWVMKNTNFQGAVQSNHADFNHLKLCCSGDRVFN